ncbi:MAG: DNA polymerase III subunit delta [Bacteroidales bacterium]|nr:DNA polymerase III subunit delta [Bacteroidales bacterium]MCD8394227.1 DNA polymerase III subunit delta [Bacteroidales bacterium]
MAEAEITYPVLCSMLSKGQYAPLYLLHGEEGYYIDELVKRFEQIIPEGDRDFNLYVMYAPEVEPTQVIEACRRYPMMADRQVVILKEAQAVPATWLNALGSYAASPNPTTILVICSRGEKAKGKDLIGPLKKSGGVVFESKKMNNVSGAVSQLVKSKGLTIDPKALTMLTDYIGSDLSKIYNEVDKLTGILGPGAMITPEAVERHIGVSKDYNNFELVAAIANRNAQKAFTIIRYFRSNPKNNNPIPTGAVLFNFFSNVLVGQYTADKSDRALAAAMGLKSTYALKDVMPAMRNYNAWQVIEIINDIRRFDAQCKGVGSRQDPFDLLHELIYKILTYRR